MNYADEMVDYYKENFPEKYREIISASAPKKSIRTNTLKISSGELKARLESRGFKFSLPPVPDCLVVEHEPFSIGGSVEFLLGLFYIMDFTSAVPALELNPRPEETVLDMCAAPGGKTCILSQLMKNTGAVVSLDLNMPKINAMISNLERTGAKNVLLYKKDARKIENINIVFDKILLDPPCSADGIACRDEKRKETLRVSDFEKYKSMQKDLIQSAFNVLKTGGTLVYSTCSLSIEENEQVMDFAKALGFKIEKPKMQLGAWTGRGFKVFPSDYKTQGFFYGRLRK